MLMKEFLTIKEFSKISGIEQTTLRYWDDIGLFSPSKRNPENNYRYYTRQQIIAVNFIKVLGELNIPLKTIGALEQKRTPEIILDLIAQQEKKLNMEMEKLRERYSIIHTRREQITYGMKLQNGLEVSAKPSSGTVKPGSEPVVLTSADVGISYKEAKNYILGQRNDWKAGEPFYESFMKFCNSAEDLRMNLSFPIGGLHDDFDSFYQSPGEPNYFFSLDPTGNRLRKEGNYLVGFSKGYYGELGDVHVRMSDYVKKNKLTLYGPVFTIYVLDEVCTTDPSQYIAQIIVSVA